MMRTVVGVAKVVETGEFSCLEGFGEEDCEYATPSFSAIWG